MRRVFGIISILSESGLQCGRSIALNVQPHYVLRPVLIILPGKTDDAGVLQMVFFFIKTLLDVMDKEYE